MQKVIKLGLADKPHPFCLFRAQKPPPQVPCLHKTPKISQVESRKVCRSRSGSSFSGSISSAGGSWRGFSSSGLQQFGPCNPASLTSFALLTGAFVVSPLRVLLSTMQTCFRSGQYHGPVQPLDDKKKEAAHVESF